MKADSNMPFKEFQAKDRRLCILLALDSAEGYSAPDALLKSFLDSVGHRVSHKVLGEDLGWLAERGLVVLETLPLALVATATQAGVDVAQGREVVAGVNRPKPLAAGVPL